MTDDAQSLAEQCGTSVHAAEALLCNLQEQKIKQWALLSGPPLAPPRRGNQALAAGSETRRRSVDGIPWGFLGELLLKK
jgi:hypothetical protein